MLKAIKKEDIIAEGFYRQFQREVETHCRLSHPHIIRLYAYFHDDVNCGSLPRPPLVLLPSQTGSRAWPPPLHRPCRLHGP